MKKLFKIINSFFDSLASARVASALAKRGLYDDAIKSLK